MDGIERDDEYTIIIFVYIPVDLELATRLMDTIQTLKNCKDMRKNCFGKNFMDHQAICITR